MFREFVIINLVGLDIHFTGHLVYLGGCCTYFFGGLFHYRCGTKVRPGGSSQSRFYM